MPRRRYRRRRHAEIDDVGDADMALASDKLTRQQACIEALERGFVQSYVDLFYLTHRADPASEKLAGDVRKDVEVSALDMVFIRDNLSRAEEARRTGAGAGGESTVFESYAHLAHHFYEKDDSEASTAVYFFDKCAEVAAMSGDPSQQMDAARNLGLSYERLADVERAIGFHEEHLSVAARNGRSDEVKSANVALVRVYSAAAAALSVSSDVKLADVVKMRRKQLDAATAAGEITLQGKAFHELGVALVADDETDEALTLLERHLTICDDRDDEAGIAEAHAAMAAAHKQRGEMAAAVVSLELLLEVAQRTANREAHASACAELGAIATQRGDYGEAMQYFEQHFEIVRRLQASGDGSQQLLDTARTLLGTAKANLRLQSHLVAVQSNLPALLRWKQQRTEVPVATSPRSSPRSPLAGGRTPSSKWA